MSQPIQLLLLFLAKDVHMDKSKVKVNIDPIQMIKNSELIK